MTNTNKTRKVKEPVRIRERRLANGNTSLYLDIYVKGTRKVESLGLYLVPEETPLDKMQNRQARQVAEKMKSDRILALRDFSVKQWDKVKRSSITLIAFLKEYEKDEFGFTKSTLKGRRDMRRKMEAYLDEIGHLEMAMSGIDTEFVKGFIAFLSTARHGGKKKEKGIISASCAQHHQAVLSGALNKAVREGILKSNPLTALGRKEKFQRQESTREFLTLDELRHAMAAECYNDNVKRAFLFSCFTGLRLGDVRALRRTDIVKSPDGNTLMARVRMQKTQRLVDVPLSAEAVNCLPKTEGADEPLFPLPSTSNIEACLSRWMESAGIGKHIAFHCARHTYATMLLTLGADIYTTSKLLGHSSVSTTQIYAKIVDQKKIETVGLVDSFFGGKAV